MRGDASLRARRRARPVCRPRDPWRIRGGLRPRRPGVVSQFALPRLPRIAGLTRTSIQAETAPMPRRLASGMTAVALLLLSPPLAGAAPPSVGQTLVRKDPPGASDPSAFCGGVDVPAALAGGLAAAAR